VTPFEAYARVLRTIAEIVPGYQVEDIGRNGALTLILARFGQPGLNRALLPRFPADEVDSTIAAVEETAQADGLAVNWWLDPGARPENLGAALDDRGYERRDAFPIMSRELVDLPDPRDVPGLALRFVSGPDEMRQAQLVAGSGFGRPEPAVRAMADAMATADVLANPRIRIVSASLDGRLVGGGTVVLVDGIAGISNVSTLPEARGRGIATEVTLLLLRHAREQGAKTAVLHASKAGFRVYQRMGFGHDGDVEVRRGPLRRS
jgi:ribosomal protein S18 acetylase RimI-like enzyme